MSESSGIYARHDLVDFYHKGFLEGQGCLALNDICEGTLLLAVPLNCCLHAPIGLHRPEIDLILSMVRAFKDDTSTMHSYMMSLYERRAQFASHPVTWSEESVLNRLQGTIAIDFIKNSIIPLRTEVEWVMIENGLDLDDDLIGFFCALMFSRAFEHEICKIAMVPLADQFNHRSCDYSTIIRDDGLEGFKMYAERDINKGEQIFNFYGPYNNQWLFSTHGFVESNNPYDDTLFISNRLLLGNSADEMTVVHCASSIQVLALEIPNTISNIEEILKKMMFYDDRSFGPPEIHAMIKSLKQSEMRALVNWLGSLKHH